jgi:hypothetical protein
MSDDKTTPKKTASRRGQDPLKLVRTILREHFGNAVILVPTTIKDTDEPDNERPVTRYDIGNKAMCDGLLNKAFNDSDEC